MGVTADGKTPELFQLGSAGLPSGFRAMFSGAAEQGIAEAEVLKKGMEEKSLEFTENGSEPYAKA